MARVAIILVSIFTMAVPGFAQHTVVGNTPSVGTSQWQTDMEVLPLRGFRLNLEDIDFLTDPEKRFPDLRDLGAAATHVSPLPGLPERYPSKPVMNLNLYSSLGMVIVIFGEQLSELSDTQDAHREISFVLDFLEAASANTSSPPQLSRFPFSKSFVF